MAEDLIQRVDGKEINTSEKLSVDKARLEMALQIAIISPLFSDSRYGSLKSAIEEYKETREKSRKLIEVASYDFVVKELIEKNKITLVFALGEKEYERLLEGI